MVGNRRALNRSDERYSSKNFNPRFYFSARVRPGFIRRANINFDCALTDYTAEIDPTAYARAVVAHADVVGRANLNARWRRIHR